MSKTKFTNNRWVKDELLEGKGRKTEWSCSEARRQFLAVGKKHGWCILLKSL